MCDNVTVERDRLDFLLNICFGSENNPYIAASGRAYRDLCRTLRLAGKNADIPRSAVDALLQTNILQLLEESDITQERYDVWHRDICEKIIQQYDGTNIDIKYGHAQKWINMVMKYLYVYGTVDLTQIFEYLHIPVDSYVMNVVEKEFSIPRPWRAWSKISNYDSYLNYQKKIRKCVDIPPLRWEFRSWIVEADKQRNRK